MFPNVNDTLILRPKYSSRDSSNRCRYCSSVLRKLLSFGRSVQKLVALISFFRLAPEVHMGRFREMDA